MRKSDYSSILYNMEQEDDLLRDLPLRTKKNRQKKFHYKQFSAIDVKSSLMEMVRSSIKNNALIDLFRNGFLNEKTSSQGKTRPKRVRSETQQQIVGKIEEKNFSFFTGKGETRNFKRSIDNVISKLNAKITYQPERSVYQEQPLKEGRSLSPLRTKYSKFSKGSSSFSKRKGSRKCSTLGGGTLQLNPVLMKDLNEVRRKRTNTFLFNIPSRKMPKKSSQVEQIYFQRDWQEQLLENINLLQGTNIRQKKNIKVERERVSSYLKMKFVNEALTTYYKFQPTQSFTFLKGIIQELVKMGEKEIRLLTFFTYDVNQDGFICEEDIYYFIARLPQHAKILEDFNAIIEFLRNNKLRSTSTNLPQKLLKMRQKSLFTALDEEQPTKEVPSHKKYSFTEKLFTVAGRSDRDTHLPQSVTQFKKFQINFQVFSLIFAEKMPVLVSQIILSFTRPISQPMLPQQPTSHLRSNSPLNKQREWAVRMGRTREMLQSVQRQNMILSQKIE